MRNLLGDVTGFALGIQNPKVLLIGPVIAGNWSQVCQLVDAIAREHNGPMRIDVPVKQAELVHFLSQCGFDVVRKPPFMIKGGNGRFPFRHSLFALAAQAYG